MERAALNAWGVSGAIVMVLVSVPAPLVQVGGGYNECYGKSFRGRRLE